MTHGSLARKLATTLATALAVTLVLAGLTARPSSAQETIKLGTLVPKASPWGKVLETWAKAVSEKSGGRLTLQIFYNGQQGDEGAMVAKIKSGQLDSALVTAVGLGKVHKPILALQLPGLFTSWAKLDAARTALRPDFEKGARDAGFAILGWSDVGVVRFLSKGFELRLPTDLQGKKPLVWRDDPVHAALYATIGGVSPVPLAVPEVLPNLNTGAINSVLSPSLMAEQLQWTSKLDHLTDLPVAYSVGALVLSQKRLDALPDDLRAILTDTAKVAASALTTRIRSEDDAAYRRLKGKMTVVAPTAAEKSAWTTIFAKTRTRLASGTFEPELVKRLQTLGQ